jgi:acetyl esterase/lipase
MDSRHLVDPELLPAVEAFPPMAFSTETLPQVRETVDSFTAAYTPPESDGIRLTERQIPGPAGAPDVRVLIYEPDQRTGPLPAVVYIHGGGFVCGRAHHSDAWSRRLVAEVGCVVAAVDYRKAPEAPFPAPQEDCYAALVWLHRNAAALGVDPGRIALEGVSAGGGLAAGVALMARDRRDPPVVFQLLVYPMLDDRTGRAGVPCLPYAGQFVWTYEGNGFGWEALLGRVVGGPDVPPYAAPARAEDLAGLPPAFIGAAALDALAPEDIRYAERLIAAGVPTELHVYPGTFHGFDAFDGGQSAVGNDFRAARLNALRRALSRGSRDPCAARPA